MQRPLEVDFLPALVATTEELEVVGNALSFLVIHVSCTLVADPGMSTSPSGINPKNVLEAKVFPQSGINDFDGHGDEGPALLADVGAGTTCPDLVIVGHVNIEDQLLGDGTEGAGLSEGFPVAGICRVDRPDFETGRGELHALFPELIGRNKRLIPDVGVVRQDKGEFAIAKVGRGCR